MGTAPRDRQYPAMPDPERFVRRSVNFLRRLGLPEQPALEVILVVAQKTQAVASERSPEFRSWLEDIERIAFDRHGSLGTSHADTKGTDDANG